MISTISGQQFNKIIDNQIPCLAANPSITVMVVNLYYTNPSLLPRHGFGYLIPNSIHPDQNPERALGVVFDSDASIGLDNIPGTKLTVMLGGRWWEGWTSVPDDDHGATLAKSVIARHLKITEEPRAVKVTLQQNCIPQYLVGHVDRMAEGHTKLTELFKGKVKVAGSAYNGVSVNDCVRSASDVVIGMEKGFPLTGLDYAQYHDVWTKWTKKE